MLTIESYKREPLLDGKAAVAPLNAAVAHAVDRAKGARTKGPLLITATGQRLTLEP